MSWNYSDLHITVRSYFLMLSKLYSSTPSFIPPTLLASMSFLQIPGEKVRRNPFTVNWLSARAPLFFSLYKQGSEDRVLERHAVLPLVTASCLCKPDFIGSHFTLRVCALPTRGCSESRCPVGKLLCSPV